ncbi:MAG: hypothetical protein ACOCVI_00575 [Planctomycetota bacterium]
MTSTDTQANDILRQIRTLMDESLTLARDEDFPAIDQRCEQMQTLIQEMVQTGATMTPELQNTIEQVIESYDRLRLQLAAARAGYTNGLSKMGKGRSSIRAYQSPDAQKPKLTGDDF